MEEQQQLLTEPAVSIVMHARWVDSEGWRVSLSSTTAYETPSLEQAERAVPACFYERLALTELLDVIDAEVRRRRQF